MQVSRVENELLLCCATNYGGPEKANRIKELVQNEIDWSYILLMAWKHGLVPLLYQNLKDAQSDGIPEDIVDTLRDQFRAITIRNLTLTAQVLRLVDLFQGNDIPAIPYKGPTLGLMAYGDVCLRQFVDLDFLIHRQCVTRVKELLRSEGYEPEYHLSPAGELIYLNNECEYNFFSTDKKILVELHWDVVQKYFSCNLEVEEFWNHLKPVSLLGREVMTFAPEHLLLIVCVHSGGKHQWEMLGWISDVAQLVKTNETMNMEWVMETAFHSGIERMVLLGLYLAWSLLSADLPSFIIERIKNDKALKSLAERVHTNIFNEAEGSPGECERFAFYLKQRERVRDKVRYCVRRLFTSTEKDWSLLKLPSSLYPLYRFIRPLRLMEKFGCGLLRKG
jgi:hypothetical protein